MTVPAVYAFVGEGICKRGKKSVPFFGGKESAIDWHEQWLLDRASRRPRLKDVECASIDCRPLARRCGRSAHI